MNRKIIASGLGLLMTAGLIHEITRRYLPPVRKDSKDHIWPFALLLGCGCKEDGSLSTAQKNRCALALALWKEGRYLRLIISGGAVKNKYVECEAMASYLRQQAPDLPILLEDTAKNTWQNFENTKALIGDVPLLVLTGSLHARRASAMAASFFSHYALACYDDYSPRNFLREIPSRLLYIQLERRKRKQRKTSQKESG